MQLNEVKTAMADKTKIVYENGEYYVSGCILRIYRNAWHYQLELHSLTANSIVVVDMAKVELGNGGNVNA